MLREMKLKSGEGGGFGGVTAAPVPLPHLRPLRLINCLNPPPPHAGRTLTQNTAMSQAYGGQTASANAVAGPGGAFTQQSATGAGSQVAGVSQTGAKVDACQRGPADSAACQTLTTAGKPPAGQGRWGGHKESAPGACQSSRGGLLKQRDTLHFAQRLSQPAAGTACLPAFLALISCLQTGPPSAPTSLPTPTSPAPSRQASANAVR